MREVISVAEQVTVTPVTLAANVAIDGDSANSSAMVSSWLMMEITSAHVVALARLVLLECVDG